MLSVLKQTNTFDYVIVHKVDRLARKGKHNVAISLATTQSGARFMSCTEIIDETPSGRFVHGIMATIANF
jgi:site-specific DNA recombinase